MENEKEDSRVLSLAGVSFTKENPCGAGSSPTPGTTMVNYQGFTRRMGLVIFFY